MRVVTSSVTCPQCGSPAVITSSDPQPDDIQSQTVSFLCRNSCPVTPSAALQSLATGPPTGQLEALEALEAQNRNLREALDNARVIGAAIGVLMTRRKITYDDALELLRRTSQLTHRKVSDLADAVVTTGDLPD